MTNLEAVEAYYKAWENGNFNVIPFADDFKFRGPIEQHDGAESFLHAMQGMFAMMPDASMTLRRRYADDDSVCMFYDFHTGTPLGSMPTSELFLLENGKIKEIRLVFDASNMRKMMEQPQGSEVEG